MNIFRNNKISDQIAKVNKLFDHLEREEGEPSNRSFDNIAVAGQKRDASEQGMET